MKTKLTKEQITEFAFEFKTLEIIRQKLELKGHQNTYVKNTNKKYGTNFGANDSIGDVQADVIVLNTLGKVNRVNEQAMYLSAMLQRDTQGITATIEAMDDKAGENEAVLNKARKVIEQANIAEAIHTMIKHVFTKNNRFHEVVERSHKYLEKTNEPNIKYISDMDAFTIFSDKIISLVDLYRKGDK